MVKNEKKELIKKLIALGARPKYKAFNYLVFMFQNYKLEQLSLMEKGDIYDVVAKKFGIPTDTVERNFRTIIGSYFQGLNNDNLLTRSMPTLGKNEQPSVKEFLIIIACNLDDDE